MRKPIFENEEEAREFFDCCIETEKDSYISIIDKAIYQAKTKGYIKMNEEDLKERIKELEHEVSELKSIAEYNKYQQNI